MTSANVELVRSIYESWERGDFSSAEWAHPEVQYVGSDGPDRGTSTGLAQMAESFRNWLGVWEGFRLAADEYRELDETRVLVLDHLSGRGKTSGLELGQIQAKGAWLFHLRGGKVTRLVRYSDRERALADLGLAPGGGSASS